LGASQTALPAQLDLEKWGAVVAEAAESQRKAPAWLPTVALEVGVAGRVAVVVRQAALHLAVCLPQIHRLRVEAVAAHLEVVVALAAAAHTLLVRAAGQPEVRWRALQGRQQWQRECWQVHWQQECWQVHWQRECWQVQAAPQRSQMEVPLPAWAQAQTWMASRCSAVLGAVAVVPHPPTLHAPLHRRGLTPQVPCPPGTWLPTLGPVCGPTA